jgi:hypothetical protein
MLRRWQDCLNLVLAMWLLCSLWIFGFSYLAGWNALITGAVIGLASLTAIVFGRLWEDWVELVLGVWLLISPWVLRYSHVRAETWNVFFVGLAIAIVALWALFAYAPRTRQVGGDITGTMPMP